MSNKDILTKILAITGNVLVWFPLLAPVVLSVLRLLSGRFGFDYLLPLELFPAVLLGGALLYWAARRANTWAKTIIVWFILVASLLVGSQIYALSSGLASGQAQPDDRSIMIGIAFVISYIVSLILLGIAGISLLRDLFKLDQQPC